MSINYHAYQNIDYLITDYEEMARQWRDKFAGFNPERVAKILNLKRDEEYVFIRMFGEEYRIRLRDGVMEKADENAKAGTVSGEFPEWDMERDTEDGWTRKIYFNEAMAIYHLLYYVVDEPRAKAGEWIPNEHLDGRFRDTNRPDPLLMFFTGNFSGKLGELEKACEACGGSKIKGSGDLSYEFRPFDEVALRLIYWDADDEFPASVKILVDKNVTDYVHMDTTGCLVAVLFKKLVDAAFHAHN